MKHADENFTAHILLSAFLQVGKHSTLGQQQSWIARIGGTLLAVQSSGAGITFAFF